MRSVESVKEQRLLIKESVDLITKELNEVRDKLKFIEKDTQPLMYSEYWKLFSRLISLKNQYIAQINALTFVLNEDSVLDNQASTLGELAKDLDRFYYKTI